MPKANPLQAALNAGEFSPRMAARVDFGKYPAGCEVLRNMIPLPQGGAARRPGTRFVAAAQDSGIKGRLLPFEFSTLQAYIIEAGEKRFRFFRNQGPILVAPAGAAIVNGGFDGDILGWSDLSSGSASIGHNAGGWLDLIGAAAGVAVAEQAVTATQGGQEQVLTFQVLGLAGDRVSLRIGSSSGGSDILAETDFAAGFHSVAFTPGVGPFYLQFRNAKAKTLGVDTVTILDDRPLELETPYAAAELPLIKWAQSADVMYLAHPDHPIRKLARSGHRSWSLVEVAWQDGPYGPVNAAAGLTLQPAATGGLGVTVTAAGHAPFVASDLGRLLRIKNGTDWGYGAIAEVVSASEVKVDVRRSFADTTAALDWALGAWSETTGYPTTVTFFEQRFAAANTRSQPQTFWLSQSADIENQRPDSLEGSAIEVQDDDALDFTIAATRVNAIRWLAPGRQLFMGTAGGEWIIASDGPVLTPSDIDVKQHASHGSADVAPARISNVALFVQRARRKVREFSFNFQSDGYRAPDLTILADHMTRGGLTELAYQEEPDSLLWCLRGDGQLAALTYLRDQDVVGWSRQILGGRFEEGPALVESLAVIPGNAAVGSEGRDEVWFLVKRRIDGATRRSLEVLAGAFEGPERSDFADEAAWRTALLEAQKRAFYVDSGLSGSFAAPVTSVTGLEHLEGETVAVLADGGVHPERVVAGGQITLDAPAREVTVGLPYGHSFRSLKLAVGAVAGTAVGKIKRVHGVTLVLLHALGGRVGPAEERLEPLIFRGVGDAMDQAVPLFSGELRVAFPGDYGRDPRLVIQGDAPLPFTLLAIAPELQTRDVI